MNYVMGTEEGQELKSSQAVTDPSVLTFDVLIPLLPPTQLAGTTAEHPLMQAIMQPHALGLPVSRSRQ